MNVKHEIESKLLMTNGNINAAITRRNWFKESDLYKNILELTQFLSKDARISERVYCILNDITSIPKCKVCNINDTRFSIMGGRYTDNCKNPKCWTGTVKRKLGANKIKHTKLCTHNKSKEDFYLKYVNNTFEIVNRDIICDLYYKMYDFLVARGIQCVHYKKYSDILLTVLKLTEFIPVVKNDYRFNERFYCIVNNIVSCQYCSICGYKMNFDNLVVGYKCHSVSCMNMKSAASKIKNRVALIEPVLLKQGFTILNKESILGLNKHSIELVHDKCNKIEKYWLKNGKWKTLNCLYCHRLIEEEKIYEFLLSITIKENIKRQYNLIHTKNKNSYQKLDFLILDKRVGIEYDGIYWHSNTDNRYHENKLNMANKENIDLLNIFSNEWMTNDITQEIWKSIIRSKLGIFDRTMPISECSIKEISDIESKSFLENNSLKPYVLSDISIGVYFRDELVSVMTLNYYKYYKKYQYNIVDWCNKINVGIEGSFDALMSYFALKYLPDNISCSIDRRFDDIKLYEANGFKKVKELRPDFYYWNKNNMVKGNNVERLKSCIEKYDDGRSIRQNIKRNDWNILYDCGHILMAKSYK